jgi:hypothetical protein
LLGKLEKCDSKNIEWNASKAKLGINFRHRERGWLEKQLGKLLPSAKHIISKKYHKEAQNAEHSVEVN